MTQPDSTTGSVPDSGAATFGPPATTDTLSPATSPGTLPPETANVVAATAVRSTELEWPFLLNEQRYLLESARFADQKAAFGFAFSLGSLAFLHQHEVFAGVVGILRSTEKVNAVAVLAGCALLLSCALLSFAVLPRLWWSSKHQLSLVFWEDVNQFGSAAKYFEAVRNAGSDTFHKELSDHCFTLAGICERKFVFVKYGMWTGTAGAVLGLFALL
jgi:hypothetical protein